MSILAREQAGGVVPPIQAWLVIALGLASLLTFYVLLRCARRFDIPNWKLALRQAQFAIVFDLALYAVLDTLRGAMLIGLPVVIVFCAFALRPRQTVVLSACAIAGLAATMTAMVLSNPAHYPLYTESVYFALTTFGMVSVTAITGELHRVRGQLVNAVDTIGTLATTDELTLLANRRHMNHLLALEESRRAAAPQHVCVALIDIDFFKAINDKYGHAAGDAVLKSFADVAGATLRAGDTLARWGGEEFLLLMPDTRLDEAVAVIERMAARIGALPLAAVDPALRITFSAGVAASLPLERFDQAIHRADEAMYRAKANGRNCVLAA
ncbi:GGDEF domain-containing protein [Massilia sp. TWR1-2-2]|uniref:GGDEF domain-containing protein n=1 Tax=Massilia sp. TWR1-2-2 TaxID=2804584 RepID=UPI003CF281DB